MKKLLTTVLITALLTCLLSVSAKEDVINFRYGDFFTGAYMHGPSTMEGTTTNSFTLHNSGGFATAITKEEYHSPTHSLKIDLTSKNSGNFSYEQSFPTSEKMLKNNIYAEVYFKTDGGSNNSLGMFRVINKTDSSAQASAEMETVLREDVGNGWCHQVVLIKPTGNIASIRIGVSYTKKNSDDPIKTIYLDDLSCRIAPYSIFINNTTVKGTSVPLEKIRIFGFDKDGAMKEVTATDLAKYRVVSGDAHIDKNGNLISSSGADGTATVEAEFLGVKTTFNVAFEPEKFASPTWYNSEKQTYAAMVDNNSDAPLVAKIIVCIYDGDRLSSVMISEKNIAANTSSEIESEKINIPFYVKNPIIRAFCITE